MLLDPRIKAFYSIMPLKNVPSVMERGILSHRLAEHVQHESVANADVQLRRERVHSYANLYFWPRNPMMYCRKERADDLCILVVDKAIADLTGVLFTDINAACEFARFFTPDRCSGICFDAVFAKNWNAPGCSKGRSCAEVLVPGLVRPEYIVGARVNGCTARDYLLRIGFPRTIKISPFLFFH